MSKANCRTVSASSLPRNGWIFIRSFWCSAVSGTCRPGFLLLGGINSLPLCDDSTWVAPILDPARREAQEIVRRPVSIQSMAGWFLELRGIIQDQRFIRLAGRSG